MYVDYGAGDVGYMSVNSKDQEVLAMADTVQRAVLSDHKAFKSSHQNEDIHGDGVANSASIFPILGSLILLFTLEHIILENLSKSGRRCLVVPIRLISLLGLLEVLLVIRTLLINF